LLRSLPAHLPRTASRTKIPTANAAFSDPRNPQQLEPRKHRLSFDPWSVPTWDDLGGNFMLLNDVYRGRAILKPVAASV